MTEEPPPKKKPAPQKAWDRRRKLEALAERGTDGEKAAAILKLEKLNAAFLFEREPEPLLFAGTFRRSVRARPACRIRNPEIASYVKWAIESGTALECLWKEDVLYIEATKGSMRVLKELAQTIFLTFSTLWKTYAAAPGVADNDRRHFYRGLYDGMMDDEKASGDLLPQFSKRTPVGKRGKRAIAHSPGVSLHPYSIALPLGRSIRVRFPLEKIQQDLADTIFPLEKAGGKELAAPPVPLSVMLSALGK